MIFNELGNRTASVLAAAGITTVEQLAQRTRDDLLKTKNIGRVTLGQIEGFLARRQMALALPRFVVPEAPPTPEWLLKYEARANAAGFKAERHTTERGGTPELWLRVTLGTVGSTCISIFGALNDFILTADVQNLAPRELMARTQVVIDALEIIAPEIGGAFAPKQEAA